MGGHMNGFRVLGDVSHTASKLILIGAMHLNRSAEGVSLITQGLYVVVFCTRYLDLLIDTPDESWWNFILKIFYIASSVYIVFLMMRVYARTREREKGWKLGMYSLAGSALGAPFVTLIFTYRWNLFEIIYTFSLILESVCVLPQLLLLRQTTVPTVIDSYYLITLGSYRAFYILNWIVRLFGAEQHFDPIAVIFGIVQTALYVDFAWVYWTRQRVKLHRGGVVDSDDISRGWLVSRVIGGKSSDPDEEETGTGPEQGGDGGSTEPAHGRVWGRRVISVSADDTIPSIQKNHQQHRSSDELADPQSFEDDETEREGIASTESGR